MSVVFNLGGGNWAGRYQKMLAYKVDNGNYIANELNFQRTTTGTFVNQNGFIEEQELRVPRVDYLNNSNGTLLVEPQRTNIVPYTEDFSQWGAINSNRTLINNTNPIDNNAYEIESSVTSSASRIYYSAIMTAGNDYSSTYLVKPSLNSPEYLGFACISNTQPDVLYDFANDQFVDFNIVGNAAKCESISMNNGWKLLKVPVHESVLNTRLNIYQGSRVGNNLYGTTGESYYIKFAQLEQGSYPTSYIPSTSGTSVTRAFDYFSGIFDEVTTQGTIFIDFEQLTQSNLAYSFRAPNYNFSYAFYFYSGGMDVYNGSAFMVDRTTLEPNNSKVAVSWNGTNVKVFINGNNRTKSNAVASIHTTSRITFQDSSDIGNFNEIKVYDTELTDAELINLTT